MNLDIIKGNVAQFTGNLKKKYAEFTDDDIAEIEANAEILSGKLQEKYWLTKEEAEEKIQELEEELNV